MARPIVTTARNVALMLALAGPAGAQEAASRLVEMPGHRALFDQLEENRDLTPFVTDGCSGGMSDAWRLVADRFEGFAEVLENEPPCWLNCRLTCRGSSPRKLCIADWSSDEGTGSCLPLARRTE